MDTNWEHLCPCWKVQLMAVSDAVVDAARECVGTPFQHQGRLIGVALDCAGVVSYAVQSVGWDVLEVQGYGRTPNKGLLKKALDEQPGLYQVWDKHTGDILLMRFVNEPQHLGIFTGSTLIHAYEAVGKCCEHPVDDKWERRIVAVYRVKDMV